MTLSWDWHLLLEGKGLRSWSEDLRVVERWHVGVEEGWVSRVGHGESRLLVIINPWRRLIIDSILSRNKLMSW